MGDFRSSFHTAPEPELPPVRRSPLPSVLAASSLPAHLHLLKSPARVLAGRYQIEGAIGKGSMGTVFRARDLQQGSLCAIKMLHQAALKEEADYQRFANEAEVIARANATCHGLAAYVFGGEPARLERVVRALRFGHVGINTGHGPTPEAPFGGMKESGYGREGGVDGLLEYCEAQVSADAG